MKGKSNNLPKKRFESKDDSQSQIIGNFIRLHDCGPGMPLNRYFKIKSLVQESQIEEINVLGYNDGNVKISVKMKEVDPELESSLKEKGLIEPRLFFEQTIYSSDKNRLSEYLDVFSAMGYFHN